MDLETAFWLYSISLCFIHICTRFLPNGSKKSRLDGQTEVYFNLKDSDIEVMKHNFCLIVWADNGDIHRC